MVVQTSIGAVSYQTFLGVAPSDHVQLNFRNLLSTESDGFNSETNAEPPGDGAVIDEAKAIRRARARRRGGIPGREQAWVRHIHRDDHLRPRPWLARDNRILLH